MKPKVIPKAEYDLTVKALNDSVEHWARYQVDPAKEGQPTGEKCGLCVSLFDHSARNPPDLNGCHRCPISLRNGQQSFCSNTPYQDAMAHYRIAFDYSRIRECMVPTSTLEEVQKVRETNFKAAALKELRFLEDVRTWYLKNYAPYETPTAPTQAE